MGRKKGRTMILRESITNQTILRESITNQTNVSLGMAKHLFSKESDKNIVFSPLSLQVVLSIIAAGCEDPTQQQLLHFLHSKSTDDLNNLVSHLVSIVLSDDAFIVGPRNLGLSLHHHHSHQSISNLFWIMHYNSASVAENTYFF